ncbi:4-oxalocrotonate tautomerase [Nitratireductor aquibiodomus]|uniref:4-oxalocrotonate tautomerase n=1 Tax=Nitratireductor aquibiodomus TaxID=204799 RepID=A0A1H4L3Q3_9HYPH|nr:4-oxalocrotonate tautomerase family protein [Nitratireductor aquibiodomus]SEB65377.1 4-oxalocrotonate tautomerase [Nitratireductor aquibiodomus]
MPFIRITLDKGRSTDKKRAVADAVTDAIVNTLGGERDWVTIVFEDIEREDWSIGGRLQVDRKGPLKPGEHG